MKKVVMSVSTMAIVVILAFGGFHLVFGETSPQASGQDSPSVEESGRSSNGAKENGNGLKKGERNVISAKEASGSLKIPQKPLDDIPFLTGKPKTFTSETSNGRTSESWYQTKEGSSLLVAQSDHHSPLTQKVEEVSKWYDQVETLNVNGHAAVYNNRRQTLHIITEENVFTIGGAAKKTAVKIADHIKF